jgi:hypothetical protein
VNEINEVLEDDPATEETKVNKLVTQQDPNMECDLPMPTEEFLKLKSEDRLIDGIPNDETEMIYDEVYYYLYMTLDQVGERQVLKTDEDWGVIHWAQEFDCGATYLRMDMPEAGSESILYTKSKNKSAFLNAVEPVIRFIPCENCYDYNPVWNDDSTSYEPADGGAGCYYSVENDSLGYLMMSWYCGC